MYELPTSEMHRLITRAKKGTGAYESKQKVAKVVSLRQCRKIYHVCPVPFNILLILKPGPVQVDGIYNRKAPLCTKPQEIAWLFHEIGNCFLMMRIFEYAHESGLKALKASNEANSKRLQMQTNILVGVAEVNLRRYKEAYQHFEQGLEFAKLLNDKKAQDTMTQALVDVNKKMVNQLKKQKKDVKREKSPQLFNVARLTPLSRGTLVSAGTSVTAE